MKVLYVCPTSGLYGDNIAILNIMPYLKQLGVEPIFYTSEESQFTERLQELNYPYICGYDVCCLGMWPRWKKLKDFLGWCRRLITGRYLKEYGRLRKDVNNLHLDMIHSNLSCTTVGYRLSQDLKIPHVWHIREYGSLDHGLYQYPTKNMLQRKFNSPGTCSVFITEGIQKFYQNPINSYVVYDGPLDSHRKCFLFTKKEKYFLFVGRLSEAKGVHYIIEEFAKISYKKPDFILKIAGTGDKAYTDFLQNLVNKLNINDKVIFLGFQKDVYPLMQHATAIVVSSRFEAFGFITSEALYNGCPVIGHDTAGTKEQMDKVISMNEIGSKVVYPYQNNHEISGFMFDAINNKLSQLKIESVHRKILSYFSAEESAKKIFRIYKKLLE